MKDTTEEMQAIHRERILARSNEERFRMGLSMCQSARELVWASLPTDLDPAERRVQFFLRYYSNDFSSDERERIVSHIQSHAGAAGAFRGPIGSKDK